MSATLAADSCAANWRAAHAQQESERLFRCRTCPIGAVHAGETAASLSPIRGQMICARCGQGATRLIERWNCVSCYNREREFKIGRNAKGLPPVKMLPLHARAIRILEAGAPRMFGRALTQSTEELVTAALRDCSKAVVFAFDPGQPARFAQRRLFG